MKKDFLKGYILFIKLLISIWIFIIIFSTIWLSEAYDNIYELIPILIFIVIVFFILILLMYSMSLAQRAYKKINTTKKDIFIVFIPFSIVVLIILYFLLHDLFVY